MNRSTLLVQCYMKANTNCVDRHHNTSNLGLTVGSVARDGDSAESLTSSETALVQSERESFGLRAA